MVEEIGNEIRDKEPGLGSVLEEGKGKWRETP